MINEDYSKLPITKDYLSKVGFVIKESNKHCFEVEALSDMFKVIKCNWKDDFSIQFGDDVEFDGFKYQSEIEQLYKLLSKKHISTLMQ